ncbi:MAG TPA: hypothetical protein PKD10_05200 [Paracoccaceae bacterium]|nr:hypothetical protein [Paracoccaceae bacterium]
MKYPVLISILCILPITASAQPMACQPAPARNDWKSDACYILVRQGMVMKNNAILDVGDFFLRLEADGGWHLVPMFYAEGVEMQNAGALAIQDRLFGAR